MLPMKSHHRDLRSRRQHDPTIQPHRVDSLPTTPTKRAETDVDSIASLLLRIRSGWVVAAILQRLLQLVLATLVLLSVSLGLS
jgi:hypothetical protein